MANATIIEAFKSLFPLFDVMVFKRISKNLIHVTLSNGAMFAFEYYSPSDWRLETFENFKKENKNG